MREEEPFKGADELTPTRVRLKGPNVCSTFERPLRADVMRAHLAAMRLHLQRRRAGKDPNDPDRGLGGA
jgi:hypothetical protein